MGARSARGRRRNQLVVIDQEAVRALLDQRGMTVASLARKTGDLEQTLRHLLNTPGARCLASRRRRLAKALGVTEAMLAGERYPMPTSFMLQDGFEFRYSARTQLAAGRFLSRVEEAVRRDFGARDASAWPPTDVPLVAAMRALTEFMMVGEWRRRFLQWHPGEHEARGFTEPATRPAPAVRQSTPPDRTWGSVIGAAPRPERDPDHEAAILGLIRAFEHIFAPWFDQQASLNYASVRDFVHLPAHPFATEAESEPPTAPGAILPPTSSATKGPPAAVAPSRKEKHS